ncbi:MAG: outer membrane beta-barrel protein [Prevotella sp.]|nr:outer membrane beta-barrel protein [Prevotella sp.]
MNQLYSLLLFTLAFLWPATHASAQRGENRVVTGRVVEAFTNQPMPDASIVLMAAADSSVIATFHPEPADTFLLNHFGMFELPVKEKGKYLLRVSCLGFKTQYKPFEVKYKREGDIDVRRIEMRPESKMLGEVTVTGTKIKMVTRGDTIVYNADAFNLAEGSMLDALIRQLPGAELNKDGEIKVNGKKIDNLLVDGRDFFEGDPKAALENLPAYTVNKIKVFDRKGKLTQMMGRDMNDKSFVMDVRLKKKYSVSTFGNAQVGGGTDDRYLASLLGVHTKGKSRLSVQGSLNNLNDQSYGFTAMGADAAAFEPQTAQGVTTMRMANIGYNYGNFDDKFSAGISVNGSHNNSHTDTWTSSQTYLAGGDTYSRQANYNRNRSKSLGANATVNYSPEGFVGRTRLNVNYTSGDSWGTNRSAQFDADPAQYGDLLDDLFVNPDKYRQLTLNRRQTRSQNDNEALNLSIYSNADVKVMADVISLSAGVNYNNSKSHNYQLQDLQYMKTGGSRDFRNSYTDAPSKSWNAELGAGYDFGLGNHGLRLEYQYSHSYDDNENALYRLDRLAGHDSTQIDLLPSTREALLSVLDSPNSYNYTRKDDNQQLKATLFLKPRFLGEGHVSIELPLNYERKTLDYFRETRQELSQNNWLLNPSIGIEYAPKAEEKVNWFADDLPSQAIRRANINASLRTSVPDIMSLVNYRDDSDPLRVSYSNPDLKKTRTFSLMGYYYLMGGPKKHTLNVMANYSRTYDAVATSMVYDKQSGRTTTKPVNVNGNWQAGFGGSYGRPLDKKERLSFENQLNANYSHSVDLNNVAGMEATNSIVHNTTLSDQLKFTFKFGANKDGRGQHQIAANIRGSYNHVTSDRDDFQRINAGDFSYGVSAFLLLPWELQFNTTLVNYSHRGYSDPDMNRDELIWGAKVSRPLIKKVLTLSLEGFDLLGQLSNRRYNINEQGRTETYTNVVSQYVMLKLTFNFQRFPKGRNGAAMPIFW